jgi:glutamyl-tRNA(Gln) amidotransferase subunit E
MDFNSVLTSLNFKRRREDEIVAPIDYLIEKFKEIRVSKGDSLSITTNWIMGQMHRQALGNVKLDELRKAIENRISNSK